MVQGQRLPLERERLHVGRFQRPPGRPQVVSGERLPLGRQHVHRGSAGGPSRGLALVTGQWLPLATGRLCVRR